VGGDPATAPERVRQALDRIRQLEAELNRIRREGQAADVDRLLTSTVEVGGVRLLVEVQGGAKPNDLRELAQRLGSRLASDPAAVVLVGTDGGKTTLVAALTAAL